MYVSITLYITSSAYTVCLSLHEDNQINLLVNKFVSYAIVIKSLSVIVATNINSFGH